MICGALFSLNFKLFPTHLKTMIFLVHYTSFLKDKRAWCQILHIKNIWFLDSWHVILITSYSIYTLLYVMIYNIHTNMYRLCVVFWVKFIWSERHRCWWMLMSSCFCHVRIVFIRVLLCDGGNGNNHTARNFN